MKKAPRYARSSSNDSYIAFQHSSVDPISIFIFQSSNYATGLLEIALYLSTEVAHWPAVFCISKSGRMTDLPGHTLLHR